MKRYFTMLVVAVLAVCSCRFSAYAVSTDSAAAILMDAASGRVLYAQNIHEPMLIASTTKLLTALVAVELCDDLDCNIAVKAEWTGIEGSSMYLQAGEIVSMRELLYGLLLQSGNDAALAIACFIAGDEGAFADLMNEKAKTLGMVNSHFVNPSGLNHEQHYSTAYDMALLARACLENETVSEICATKSAVFGTRTFYNHNKLLSRYEGCVGMKTGYTELAGRTLVSAAERNGQILICVTLNDRNDWKDHEKLLDYGFSAYPQKTLCNAGMSFGQVRVEGSLLPAVSALLAENVVFPLAEGEVPDVRVDLPSVLYAPVTCGDLIGEVSWLLDGNVIARAGLVSSKNAGNDVYLRRSVREHILRWLDRMH